MCNVNEGNTNKHFEEMKQELGGWRVVESAMSNGVGREGLSG